MSLSISFVFLKPQGKIGDNPLFIICAMVYFCKSNNKAWHLSSCTSLPLLDVYIILKIIRGIPFTMLGRGRRKPKSGKSTFMSIWITSIWTETPPSHKENGYYWSKIVKECLDYTWMCNACQFHANFIHQLLKELDQIIAYWLFDVWWLDVAGLLPISFGEHLFILATKQMTSKWVDVVALKKVKKKNVVNFI